MRFEEFASAYPRDYGEIWYADAARHDITRDAASWAHLLGQRLHDFLSGAASLHSPSDALRELATYSRWNQQHFVDTVRAIQGRDGGARGVRAMHFHTMAHCLLPMWKPVLGAGRAANVRERRVAQLLLAVHAGHMITRREELLTLSPRPDSRVAAILAVQHGMLTETDALVVVLEIVRHLPDLVVLPAPPQFESSSAARNADLLVLDLTRRTVAGIQVKTSLVDADKVRRQHGSVVLVDGVADLGNQRLVPVHPRSSTKRPTVWPGLISAHFVLGANPRSTVFAPWRASIEQLQAQLPQTVHGTSDYLRRAVPHLRQRILEAIAD
ncbi:hypothetical protein [uncultured Microbacterium sp.]|uniref:hypothetical protein n=1 Tax=uncultured Microbacterium sp. TaxID=191216 RepID=UPI0035C949AF